MLKHRLQSGLLLGAALLAAAFWLPSLAVLVLLMVLCGIGSWEFYRLLDAAQIPHFKFVGTLGGIALILTTWVGLANSGGMNGDGAHLVLFAVTLCVFVRQFPQKNNPRPLQTIAATLLGVMYVPYLLNFFTKLLMSWGAGDGRWLVLYLIVVVKSSDIGAYFVGCSLGRHKLIPRISPAKSWEGTLGGIAVGTGASHLFSIISHGNLGVVHLPWTDAILLGVLLSVLGVFGDLTESLLKRAAGVKDSGRIILGMGGLLDLLDSLLFAAPALYFYAHYFLERLP